MADAGEACGYEYIAITDHSKGLKIAGGISEEQLLKGVEKSLRKYFGKRGERVVQDNLKAVQRGYEEVIEIPREVMLATAAADERNAGLRVI